MATTTTNRYLRGPLAPVREELTLTDLTVTGTIPAHLDGRYLRNGPNPVTDPDPATHHWFVGDGMIHGLRLRDGRAEWYRNRWVRSEKVAETLGEPARPGPVHAGMDSAPNTNVIGHAGRTFAIVESGPRPYELTEELDTIGPCDFDGTLPGGYTAHPHRDPVTGELHALSYFWGWGNRVQYSVLDNEGLIRRTVDIEVGASPMMHDFSLTERHVVVYDLPVIFDLDAAMGGSTFPYGWSDDYPARIGVMGRDGDGSDIRWFDVDPCYVFHPMNAYDVGDRLVIDLVRHPKMFATDTLGPNEGAPTLDRWTIDLTKGKVDERRIHDRAQEFPRIDERLTGSEHRYGYTVGFDLNGSDDVDFSGTGVLYRHDRSTDTAQSRTFGAGHGLGEFVFIPNDGSTSETDGVLMGLSHDIAAGTTALRIVDAATLDDIASVALPVRVPVGFHGNWIPN